MIRKNKETLKTVGRGNNPKSRANLKPCEKGERRNPFGKKAGTLDRATSLKKWLELKIKFKNQSLDEKGEIEKIFEALPAQLKITVEESIAFALIAEAKNGNIAAIREINDTLYGKLTEKSEIEANVNLKSVDEFNKESEARLKAAEAAVKERE